jgi:hypothetical protein
MIALRNGLICLSRYVEDGQLSAQASSLEVRNFEVPLFNDSLYIIQIETPRSRILAETEAEEQRTCAKSS